MRHSKTLRGFDPKRGVSIATLAYEYSAGFQVPEHAHGADQLIYAIRGVMEVFSGQSIWLVPPRFALWVPAKTYHRIHMPGAVSMRTLYFRPGLVRMRSPGTAVLHVTRRCYVSLRSKPCALGNSERGTTTSERYAT
ncbi:AraC family ligand binding domain-containing protein [Tunturiibacter gelidoferens]